MEQSGVSADHSSSSSSAAPGMTFASLPGLTLRLIAMKLSDPGPLSQSCSAAYNAVYKDTTQMDFELEWFLRWVHVLAPLRPWQFAAVGWQRLGGQHATAEQLCSFILRVCAAKRQQQVLLHTGRSSMQPRIRPEQPPGVQKQQPQPPVDQEVQVLLQQLQVNTSTQQPGAANSAAAVKPVQPPRSRFSAMPQCLPKLSIEQQAQKQLSQGHVVRALRLLCDGPPWLLYQYAAAAGNLQLTELLITEQNRKCVPAPYQPEDFPTTWMETSEGTRPFTSPEGHMSRDRSLSPAQLCAYAAMRKGHVHVLTSVLWRGGSSIKGTPSPHQMGQLLRFAVRHTNAACLQTLLDFVSCDDTSCGRLVPWPQHLAVAASRADPWAGEVVALLLRVMDLKLLAAKYMRPVYLAACRTGHVPVLQQLVQWALPLSAAGSAGHVCKLLSAAAEARNPQVWRALLGQRQEGEPSDGRSSGSSSSSGVQASSEGAAVLSMAPHQQQQQGQSNAAHESQALALPAAMVSSALKDPADMLCQLLQRMGSMPLHVLHGPNYKLHLQEDADCAAMADAFMQWLAQVPPEQVLWANSSQNHASGFESIQAEMRARLCLDAFPWAPGSLGRLQQLLAGPPGSGVQLVWLLQHDMLPVPPPGWQPGPAASQALTACICYSMKYGQREAAHTLWRFARQLGVQLAGEQLAQAAFDGAVCAAAAAEDHTALQHLLDFALHYRRIQRYASIAVRVDKHNPLTAADQFSEDREFAEPVISLLQQAVEAAALTGQQEDSKVQCAARIVSAYAAAAGEPETDYRPTACPTRSWQQESSSIMPLWQHAAVAVTARLMLCDLFQFQVDHHTALVSVLEPVPLGFTPADAWPADYAATQATSPSSSSAAATPVFLKGAAVGASSLLSSPVPPPEHQMLAAALSSLQPPSTSFTLWCWNRPDAAAWLLHSQQQHLHANSGARSTAAAMTAKVIDFVGYPVLQQPPVAALQEQQLQWHGLQLHKLGFTEGFGALPRLAAGAADLVTVLLSLGYAVDASRLVKRLNGATGAAAVECAKTILAAVLAFPLDQLHVKGVKFEIPIIPRDRREVFESGKWLCVSPAAVRKALDVGDMDLITLLILWNQRMYGVFEGVS